MLGLRAQKDTSKMCESKFTSGKSEQSFQQVLNSTLKSAVTCKSS